MALTHKFFPGCIGPFFSNLLLARQKENASCALPD